ncbi:acetyltransferase [Paenibacillus odorifer]|uniref:acetyltransferase n=1 Tax=Paenibacillus TaxID=44249 RepID=UPI00096D5BF4|nr:acetyltransferase [Paenibacillus odorifer]OMC67811.1 acetyltransferase [Paenibacillus odorifer]
MNKGLIIIGAGGHGKVVADIAKQMNKWTNISFLDDNESFTDFGEFEIVGKIESLYKFMNNYDVFVAIGSNKVRENVQNKLEIDGASIVSLVHPQAIIGTDVKFGIGTVIMAGVIINSSTTIGKGCIVNTASSVDHDNIIGDFVHISPGTHLAGNVKIGKGAWLGVGSTVSNGLEICNDSKLGAGAVVIKNILELGTYVGVPARKVE